MIGEFDFYATHSGLQAGTLADHQHAFWAKNSGLAAGNSLDDHMLAAMLQVTGATRPSLTHQAGLFFGRDGRGGGFSEKMFRFFALDVDPFSVDSWDGPLRPSGALAPDASLVTKA